MIPVARPRIVVEDKEIFYIFRDEERGSRVSMAHTTDVSHGKWSVTDLTDFQWMPGNRLMIPSYGRNGGNCICLYSIPAKEMVNVRQKSSRK